MMHAAIIALATLVAVCLAHHLGLIEAAYKVAGKIAKCPMCCTFWACLIVLLISDAGLGPAICISVVAAYLSNWVGLILDSLAKLYTRLWTRKK